MGDQNRNRIRSEEATQAVEMSGPDGGPIQTQEIKEAVAKLTQEERLELLTIYRKAGLKLPRE